MIRRDSDMPNTEKRMERNLRRNLKSIEKAKAVKPETMESDKPSADAKKPVSPLRRIAKILGNILFALVLLAVAFMAFFMIRSKVKGTPPMIAGHYLFIVLSGSMEPEFNTGSIVFVKPVEPETIVPGEIVTFSGFAGSKQLTTHRVMDIENDEDYGLLFITKGDANEHNDPDPVPAKNIKGTVSGHVPLLGYLMSFVQTKQGLILLIMIPACLLIGVEVYSFLAKREENKSKNKKKKPAEGQSDEPVEPEDTKTDRDSAPEKSVQNETQAMEPEDAQQTETADK